MKWLIVVNEDAFVSMVLQEHEQYVILAPAISERKHFGFLSFSPEGTSGRVSTSFQMMHMYDNNCATLRLWDLPFTRAISRDLS